MTPLRAEWLRLEAALASAGLTDQQRQTLNWSVMSIRKILFGSIARPTPQDALRQFQTRHPEI